MFAQPTISYWGLSVERGLWRAHCSTLNRLKWSMWGSSTKSKGCMEAMWSARPLSHCGKAGCEGLRICEEGKSLKAIFLTGRMWKPLGGEEKKGSTKLAFEHCFLPCPSSSLLTVILRPSLASKVSSLLFLVAEYGFRPALPLSTTNPSPEESRAAVFC